MCPALIPTVRSHVHLLHILEQHPAVRPPVRIVQRIFVYWNFGEPVLSAYVSKLVDLSLYPRGIAVDTTGYVYVVVDGGVKIVYPGGTIAETLVPSL
jgi:hypothetical protein